MKRILIFTTILTASIISFTLNSCKKDTPDTETQSSVDNTVCENEFNKSLPIVNSFTIKQQGIKSNRTAGPIITIGDTTHGFPRTMTIDYLTGTTDSLDNKVRKGQIFVTFYDRWHVAGARAVVKLNNYFVANNSSAEFIQYDVDSILIIHNSLNSFTHNIIGGKCIAPDWYLEWSSNRTVTQIAGDTTLSSFDDVFSTTGNSKGKDRNGKSYTVNITSPIIKRATCAWMEQGTLVLTPDGFSARTIDYGSGTCDSKATLTINGNTFTFNMN